MVNSDRGAPSVTGAMRLLVQGLLDASVRRARRQEQPRRTAQPVNADYAALKAQVKARGLLTPRPAYYACVVALVAGVVAAAVWWAITMRDTPWLWLAAPLLAFASGQIALLGHEAAHHAIARTARANERLSLLFINVLTGANHRWWTGSHNEHHARSNEQSSDPDIDYPFLAFSDEQARHKPRALAFVLTRQHWLAPLLMCFVGVSLRVYGLAHFVRRGARPWEVVAAATFYAVYVPAMLLGLGGWRGLSMMVLHQALFGLYLGSVTSVNHWGMPMPEVGHRLDYLRHQVTTARNLRGDWLADLWFGGLNRQIEHHLFPTMPRNRLREAAPLVRAFCAERAIGYHEVSILDGYREMYQVMRRVAAGVRARIATASTQWTDSPQSKEL